MDFRGLVRPKEKTPHPHVLKHDEAERLIDASPLYLQPLIVFLLYTGARAGEALWLDWNNVDLERKQVTFPDTKNGEPRSVPLHSRVVAALANLEWKEGRVFRTQHRRPYQKPKKSLGETSAGSKIWKPFQAAVKSRA